MSAPMLWTAEELVAATGGRMIGEWGVNGIDIDSREIGEGDLFVALSAARDGHDFVAGAIDAGAAGALVSHVPDGLDDAPLLIVDDVENALRALGQYRRDQAAQAKFIAVTGSAGKTSTKEMLRHVLSGFGKTHASVRSFNNHYGVPITLARMPRDSEFAIFEIGMNAPGEIEPLARQVCPDIAIINTIAAVHLAGFENEEGIAHEKASILRALGDDGLGVVFGDLPYRDIIVSYSAAPIQWFGFVDGKFGANDIIQNERVLDADGSYARIAMNGRDYEIRLGVEGAHHQHNAMAVLAVIDALGLDADQALAQLRDWQAPAGRGEVIAVGGVKIVDQSYNANPLSMRAALESFALMPAKRRVAILGDMGELGVESERFHREVAAIPALEHIDAVVTVGSKMRILGDFGLPIIGQFDRHEALETKLDALIAPGDAVMFKASLGVGLGKSVDALVNILQRSANKAR